MFWNTWNCFSNDFIDRDQVTVARISFCNWIYFLSPTIRISLQTPRQSAGEQHRRVAWPGVITFMIRIWLLHSRHFWESVEQRGWCFKLLWFWATWTISWVHYAEALYWMRHLSWGMWRAGEYWGGEMLQVGGWTDLMLTFHIDWLLSLDESILTTDKYLNWILSNGDTDNENWVDTTVHNWDDLKLWDN